MGRVPKICALSLSLEYWTMDKFQRAKAHIYRNGHVQRPLSPSIGQSRANRMVLVTFFRQVSSLHEAFLPNIITSICVVLASQGALQLLSLFRLPAILVL